MKNTDSHLISTEQGHQIDLQSSSKTQAAPHDRGKDFMQRAALELCTLEIQKI